MKIVTIVGARPQFIKAAALSRVLRQRSEIREIIIHTGQHYDDNMSDVFFRQMDIPEPDYNLAIAGLDHGAMTGRMLEGIEKILLVERPDWVLVYGDTNSTLAGALAAAKAHIPVAHVESGLRSFNRQMPEEINRVLTDHVSDMPFAPTQNAVDNLISEGIDRERVHLVGDVMFDAALFYARRSKRPHIPSDCFSLDHPFGLATIHRAENTDNAQRLREIFAGLREISNQLPLLLPLHPRTRFRMEDAGIKGVSKNSNLCLIEPVGYLEMVFLLQNCDIVLTDSGGLQKEAFFFNKPCVTLRSETEWVELVELGVNMLAFRCSEDIINAFDVMKNKDVGGVGNPYGQGNACGKIVECLLGEMGKI